jgi:hypothetical protein
VSIASFLRSSGRSKHEHIVFKIFASCPRMCAPYSQIAASFLEHYGRWVAFDSTTSPEVLLHTIRQSPLLLCACCLIAVRHHSMEAAQNLAPLLFEKAKFLLSSALLLSSQGLEFFQAVIVLCMWSTTVGQNPLGIDSWLVSGFALQHCLSTKLFRSITGNSTPFSQSRQHLDRLRIYNHLVLVHLQYVRTLHSYFATSKDGS